MDKKQSTLSRRQQIKAQRSKRKKQQRASTILIIGGVAILVVAILAYPSIKKVITPVGEFVQITPQARPQADFNSMGDPDAPVKIENYSDFQCPFCKRFADQTEPQIVDEYVTTGKVFFTFIPYGPGGLYIGPESKDAAMASFCAGEQDLFWEYHDILFANHTGENIGDYTKERLFAFAESLGLDMDQFQSCFSTNKYEAKLNEGIAKGRQANVGGTPSFLINGKLIEGAQPFSTFQQEIEAALAASSN